MILLSFDLETTGTDRAMDRPIEVGAILYTTGQRKCLESSGYLVKSDVPIRPEITELTGITQSALDKFGYESHSALEALLDLAVQADAFIGQNVKRFDKPFLENWCTREKLVMPNKLWIDTRTDLPGVVGKHLGYMAADAGFLNMFPHSALADCQTVIKLVQGHDIDKVVERAKSPEVVLLAQVSYDNRNQAKERKYAWNGDYKIWWKMVKQMELDAEVAAAPFDCAIAGPEISLEKLWYD